MTGESAPNGPQHHSKGPHSESKEGKRARARVTRKEAGGKRQLGGAPTAVLFQIGKGLSALEAHDLVTRGLSVDQARELMESFQYIDRATVLKIMGISERTLQRARAAAKPLDSNATDRSLRLAAVTGQAISVLGSQVAAERWLASPALGLDRRRPIDLLQSSEGTNLVKTLLTRMDHGVYA
jgi:putative toxin-antitoxin system antitoxin component (TIGR02293 family)